GDAPPRPRRDRAAPIGVFDSGVGGLSVLREIRRELPAEDLLYVADSGYAPYGDKPAELVLARSVAVVDFLVATGAKAVVVACNTATGVAVDALRARHDLPIVAIEPAVKPAAARTRSGAVGVLATTQTLAGPKFARLVAAHANGVRVIPRPAPDLVDLVEAGDLASERTGALVRAAVHPLVEQGVDTIVLGCTHYPFLASVIAEAAGPGVTVVDSAVPVARQVRRRLAEAALLRPGPARGSERFWTTGALERVGPVVERLWGAPVEVHEWRAEEPPRD
ncbi:MAG TPA: glutamate racemase, partial [Longimicrobiales bacterium]|nr:glutamate racemase [Longimicrobiales bacterium]